jgi:hypothetical protein
MLDLTLALYDVAGNLLTASATSQLGESISWALDAGSYRLSVTSAGGYGDVGQYFISGSAVPEPVGLTVTAAVVGSLVARRRVR